MIIHVFVITNVTGLVTPVAGSPFGIYKKVNKSRVSCAKIIFQDAHLDLNMPQYEIL